MDSVLRDHLHLEDGISTQFLPPWGKHPIDPDEPASWQVVGIGGHREDDPAIRGRYHFYEPRRDRGFGPLRGSYEHAVGNLFGWNSARRHFFEAFAAPTEFERERELAWALRKLGQVTHLIQDAVLPTHARDDAHTFYLPLEEIGAQRYNTLQSIPVPRPGPYKQFPWSLRDFWDRDDLDRPIGVDPCSADVGRPRAHAPGVAEWAHFNFVSPDTMFGCDDIPRIRDDDHIFPHPDLDATTCTPVAPGGALLCDLVRYHGRAWDDGRFVELERVRQARYRRPRALLHAVGSDGAEHLVGALLGLGEDIPRWKGGAPGQSWTVQIGMTEEVLTATVDDIIPVAASASTAMIDYFFRGELEYEPGTEPGLFRVRNTGPEAMQGTLFFYFEDRDGNRREAHREENVWLPRGAVWPEDRDEDWTLWVEEDEAPRAVVTVFKGDMGGELGLTLQGDVPGPAVAGHVEPIVPDWAFFIQRETNLRGYVHTTTTEGDCGGGGTYERIYPLEQVLWGHLELEGRTDIASNIASMELVYRWLEDPPEGVAISACGMEDPLRIEGIPEDCDPVDIAIAVDLHDSWGLPDEILVTTKGGAEIRTPLLWWGYVANVFGRGPAGTLYRERCKDGDGACWWIAMWEYETEGRRASFYAGDDPCDPRISWCWEHEVSTLWPLRDAGISFLPVSVDGVEFPGPEHVTIGGKEMTDPPYCDSIGDWEETFWFVERRPPPFPLYVWGLWYNEQRQGFSVRCRQIGDKETTHAEAREACPIPTVHPLRDPVREVVFTRDLPHDQVLDLAGRGLSPPEYEIILSVGPTLTRF